MRTNNQSAANATPLPEGSSTTSNPVGEHPVKLGRPKTVAAPSEQRASMPDTSLVSRATTAIIKKSKSVGFLSAFWDYISNSSSKSWNQARLNVAAKDYLKANPKKINGLSQRIVANILSQDPRIVQAFAVALKEVDQKKFNSFHAAIKNSIDAVLTKWNITSDETKQIVNLVGELNSMIEFSQPALALRSLVQRLPADQITLDLVAFCKDFPDQAQALAGRQDLQRESFQGTDCNSGLLVAYDDSRYNPKILDIIIPELFEGNEQDDQIESFLKSPAVKNNIFFVDGIQRCDMPHISLPNGVEILSNFGDANSEYCKKMGKPYNQAKYLKHMLDQFKKAYGSMDEAIKAFKVFMQNFTGSGNTLVGLIEKLISDKAVLPELEAGLSELDLIRKAFFMNTVFTYNRSQSMMRMDESFNINFNVTACTSGESIKSINSSHAMKESEFLFPEDTIFGITVSSHIPAVRNDTMDQRGQQGQQTTTFGVIDSLENRGSNQDKVVGINESGWIYENYSSSC
ncbi:MAG: hypothetical protein LBC11_00795 [Puniceicoccales bacterium]|jgi:hypothetical protein|nr:hypothetical protein [Puniceicoccales bacterium]